MNDIRLIASDVDGTMLPRGGVISARLRRAIAGCRAAGIPFIIASGRWIGALGDVVAHAGTSGLPMIICNGAAVVDDRGEPLREWLLDDQDARQVYDILKRHEVQINSYLRGALYCQNTWLLRRKSSMIKGYIGGGDYKLVLDDPARFEAEALSGVCKLEALSEDPGVILAVKRDLAGLDLSVTHSSGRNVEIMAPGVGKGAALRWLAGRMGIPAGNCMAFGDNMNDWDLLSAVGWPVAMENGDPELKKMARIVAPSDADDGVAKIISAYILEEET